MVQEYAVRRVRALNEERQKRIAALQTREDAEKYVAEVRAKVRSCFSFTEDRSVPPAEKCGVIECDGYKIEKIIYYSREKFAVTAEGMIYTAAQTVAIDIARFGIVAERC